MQPRPQWLTIGEQLLQPVLFNANEALERSKIQDLDTRMIPLTALWHLANCLETSMATNENGQHAVAICLVRQCIETLTIIDTGLQRDSWAEPLLKKWKQDDKFSSGKLRKRLEQDTWPRYGIGLWNEPWSQFFANLAKAVQPYAHYTEELRGWQMGSPMALQNSTTQMVRVGPRVYDALKASRITLIHTLVVWTLGRLLLAHGQQLDILKLAPEIQDLGNALATSKLLIKQGDWGTQLLPHMWFKGGQSWRDI